MQANSEARPVRTGGHDRNQVRKLTVTAMLSAVAFVLMFLDFPIPMLMPSFVKMDFSDLPELLGAFALGPAYGVLISLIKNLIHLLLACWPAPPMARASCAISCWARCSPGWQALSTSAIRVAAPPCWARCWARWPWPLPASP